MDEEEFAEWLETLSPEEQNEVFYNLQYAGANQIGPSFGGFMAPEMPMGGYDLAQIGGGVNVPEFDKKGNVDPYDLTQMAKRINVGQDIATGYVDNALAMLGGPGAYDVSAFQDTMTAPTRRLALPGQERISRLRSGGGFEAFLADAISNRGLSPAAAMAEMWTVVNSPDSEELSADQRAQRQSIIDSLPSNTRQQGGPQPPSGGRYGGALPEREGRQGYDEGLVYNTANSIFDAMLEDEAVRSTGWVDEEGQFGAPGTVYEAPPETTPSPAAKWYRDRGLPLPTETYDSDKYINSILDAQFPGREKAESERRAREQEAQLKSTVLQAGAKTATQQERDLTKAYEESITRPAGAATRPGQAWEAMSMVPNERQPGLPQGSNAPPQLDLGIGPARLSAGVGSLASQYRPEYAPAAPYVKVDEKGNVAPIRDFGGSNAENAGVSQLYDFFQALPGLVSGDTAPEEVGRDVRRMGRSDIANLGRTTQGAKRASLQAQRALFNEQYRKDPDALSAARSMGQLAGLSRAGRTPLQDAIAQRALVQRSMGMIG